MDNGRVFDLAVHAAIPEVQQIIRTGGADPAAIQRQVTDVVRRYFEAIRAAASQVL